MSRVLLGVNIDHVATLRQARGTLYPDPIAAALVAEQSGADGITLHLREDRRHIQDQDVVLMKQRIATRMNFEMAATDEMVAIAARVLPQHCCIVPERREEVTTEGGLDVVTHFERIAEITRALNARGIEVSLFIDPEPAQIEAARRCDAAAIEIHTGHYADAASQANRELELQRVRAAITQGLGAGLIVNAGHGLHYENIAPIAAIPGLNEVNIGHAIVARAVFTGLGVAVKEMKRLIDEAAGG